MPYPFATARHPKSSPLARAILSNSRPKAQNDNSNDSGHDELQSDMLLVAALRCFAQHGLRAAEEAHDRAERAFQDGERASCDWWLGVCRMLDRRMACDLSGRLEPRVAI